MKQIVFTVSNDLTFDQRMIKICSSLSKSEFKVKIIGFEKNDSRPIEKRAYSQERVKVFFQKGKLFYLEICIRLFFKLLFTRTDIISAVDMDTLFPAFLISKLRNKVLVFDAHEYYSETSGLVGRKFEKSLWSGLESILIPNIKNAYTVNKSLADIFFKRFGTQFGIILNVPVIKMEDQAKKKHEHFYLYQGVLNKGRGLEELVDVFSKNKLHLKIAGIGPLRDILKEKINQMDIGERVELIGFVKPEELMDLSIRAHAGFNLIEGLSQSYYYSLANKFFDYMHAEIPQIGMNFPEYKRINDQYEISILIDSFSEIESAINKLELEKSYYQLLVNNTSLAKKEYNWAKEEKKLIKFYLDLS